MDMTLQPIPVEHALDKSVDPLVLAQRQLLVTIPSTVPRHKRYMNKSSMVRMDRIADAIANDHRLIKVSAWPLRSIAILCVVYELPADRSREQAIRDLASDPRVESVQPMQLYSLYGSNTLDPLLHLQYGMQRMSVQEAHRTTTGIGTTIAIIDTGVDTHHPDLEGRVSQYHNFVASEPDHISPDYHGTAIAGVIGARSNNAMGIAGIAPEARLMVLQACWENGSRSGLCSSFSLALALDFAIDTNPDIINMSLSGPDDELLHRLVKVALDKEITIVAAQDDDLDHAGFPANINGVLAVNRSGHDKVIRRRNSLSAPGTDILSTAPAESYDFYSGNSLAAAHISGVVALLLQINPKLTNQELYAALTTSIHSAPTFYDASGHVNACRALEVISTNNPCL